MKRRSGGLRVSAALGVALIATGALLFVCRREPPQRAAAGAGDNAAGTAAERASTSARRQVTRPRVVSSGKTPGESVDAAETRAHHAYDASLLALEVEGGAETVWKAERRDAAWASQREHDIAERLAAEIEVAKIDARIQGIECRASTCRVAIDVVADSLDSILGQHPVMMFAPTTLTMSGDPATDPTRTTQLFYLAFPPELRGSSEYAAFMDGRREWALDTTQDEELPP
jgi:hypothetical protein